MVDAYDLDAPLSGNQARPMAGMPAENACLRVIRQKYASSDKEKKAAGSQLDSTGEMTSSSMVPKKIELNYTLNIHLVYNQSM